MCLGATAQRFSGRGHRMMGILIISLLNQWIKDQSVWSTGPRHLFGGQESESVSGCTFKGWRKTSWTVRQRDKLGMSWSAEPGCTSLQPATIES